MRVVERNRALSARASETRPLFTLLVLAIMTIPTAAMAQNGASFGAAAANNGSVTASAESRSASPAEAEIAVLKKQMAEQQKQIDELRLMLEEQKKLLAGQSDVSRSSSMSAPAKAQPDTAPINAKTEAASAGSAATKPFSDPEPQPLSFSIGSAHITPVGFMDLTAFFRSTNTGTGIGTNFGSIPLSNTTAGNLTEFRLSAQNSRIGLRVDANVKGANVIGYFESDFLGAVPGNVAVSSTSAPNRLRLYWVDVRKGKLELLGGQSWSMLTPNRKGLSPLPSDIFYTQNVDVNYQAGLVWGRQPQVRFIYHPNKSVALGLSLENPEQYIGGSAGGGLITLPAALVTPYANELNNGNTSLNVPNVHPDIVTKVAFDTKVNDHSLHLELAGVLRTFRVYNPLTRKHYAATGGGGSVNLNLELVKNLRFVSNNFYSDGGGRWIFGQAPDLIVRGDGSPSLVHSGSTVTGFEAQATKNTQIYGYYGGVYVQRNVAIDPANGNFIGYGYAGSPSGQNRVIHQATFGFTRTFWRDPKYGALQLMGQYSYISRHPWNVATGQPTDGHVHMTFMNLRYLLPGAPPPAK
jgi:hypothetical protein